VKKLEQIMTDISSLKHLHYFSNITELSLLHQRVADLKYIEHLPHLEELCLTGNLIKKVDNLERNKKLRKVNLDDNQVSDICYKSLQALGPCL
jgi:Leucine-rich repeat (LRR) protein